MKKEKFFLTPSQINTSTIYNNEYALLEKNNNSDWDYWLLVRITDLYEAFGWEGLETIGKNCPAKYSAEIIVVAPAAAGIKQIESAAECCGIPVGDIAELTEEQKVSLLADDGVSATLWAREGHNYRELVREAKRESKVIPPLFGFYMDKAQNRIGSTGWDFVAGNN